MVCDQNGTISDNDSVIFFNFRPDRAREITRSLVDPEFDGFTRQFFPLVFVCNTEYDATMPNVQVAFPKAPVRNGLGEYLSSMGMTQLRIAETEKSHQPCRKGNDAAFFGDIEQTKPERIAPKH